MPTKTISQFLVKNFELTNISIDNLPTTGLAEIDFNCLKWNNVSSKNSNLIEIKFPKQLK